MNGEEFFEFLLNFYNQNGQLLYGNFTFCDWLLKPDGTHSFRFNVTAINRKSIPEVILIAAWNANQQINDNWLVENFNLRFYNDCRLYVLNHLFETHNNLR